MTMIKEIKTVKKLTHRKLSEGRYIYFKTCCTYRPLKCTGREWLKVVLAHTVVSLDKGATVDLEKPRNVHLLLSNGWLSCFRCWRPCHSDCLCTDWREV